MKYTIIYIGLLFCFMSSHAQIQKAILTLKTESGVDTVSNIQVSDFKTHYYKADLTPWIVLKDSGNYNLDKVKNGFWKEFPIDTTALVSNRNIRTLSKLSEVYKPQILRLEGKYVEGKKQGLWKTYNANIINDNYYWYLVSTCEYENDLKNGMEVLLNSYSNDTLMTIIYKDNQAIEVIE